MRYRNTLASISISFVTLLHLCASFCEKDQHQDQRLVTNIYGSQEWRNHMEYEYRCQDELLPMSLHNIYDNSYCSYSSPYECDTILWISSSNLSIVPSSSFSSIPGLTKLYLENQYISSLIPGAFNGLRLLKEIYLSRNNLTKIGVGIFNSLFELKTLDLSKNRIDFLGAHSFSGLTNLKLLNLSNNMLVSFENSIWNNEGMRLDFLDLSFNNISTLDYEIDFEFGNMDLSNNKLVELEFCISNLRELNVSSNRITRLRNKNCSSDLNSTMLSFISSSNEISHLDFEFFSTSENIRIIQLQHNNISSIPNGLFSNLHNLISLNISYNKIANLDHGTFDSLEKLEILDISHNMIKDISSYLHSLEHLRELHVEYNKIFSLDGKQLVTDLPLLNELYLYNNDFTCENLIEIMRVVRNKNVRMEYGNETNVTNIRGISCKGEDKIQSPNRVLENINSELERIIMSKLGQMSDKEFKRSALYSYFNSDFKDSNFYKYMESLKELNISKFNETKIVDYFNKDFENTKFFKYLENLRNVENFSIEFNKSVYDYFNNDFRNSGFVKYLDGLKNANDLFSNTSMLHFFNNEFKDTAFYRYQESFRMFSEILNSSKQNLSDNNSPKISDNNKIPFVILIMLLIILSCNLLYLTYLIRRKININATISEQVELMDA